MLCLGCQFSGVFPEGKSLRLAPMRMLIVEDDVPLREAIAASAANWTIVRHEGPRAEPTRFHEIVQAGSVDEGKRRLGANVDVMLVDVKLGNESGLTLVEHALKVERVPLLLAMSGQATATEAFQLAALGVIQKRAPH